MKKLLTGIVAGVATITLGASCVLAATQMQNDGSVKENSFPICYPNCDINSMDNNTNGICDNVEEGICSPIQNVETIVNEPSVNEQPIDYQENAQTNESNYEVNQDVEVQGSQQPFQPYYCPDCGSNYVDNNGNGICDNAEQGICPPAQNTEIQGGNQSAYCPDCGSNYVDNNGNGICDNAEQGICPPAQNTEIQGGNQSAYCPDCGSNYVDNNGNGICDHIEEGICPPAQNTTGNGYYGHHGNNCNGYGNTQSNNNYNYGHHGGHCRR